ncbi:MAG: M1 family metallopeptidase, partial [Planctomycetota bacterium]
MRSIFAALVVLTMATPSVGQHLHNHKHHDHEDKFYQIDSWLPSPNVYRAADGAPGPEYWQQRADYDIRVRLNDRDRRLDGTVRIDYHNRSPMSLGYIWVQLDQNRFSHLSAGRQSATAPSLSGGMTFDQMRSLMTADSFDGGYKIKNVSNATGDDLRYIINDTMMRIDLAKPLKPGEVTTFEIGYSYNIVDAKVMRARAGYEYFEEDDNAIYEIAQFYPRVAAYTDYVGWQNKRFLGRGEFTLEMGDYHVEISAPKSMVVAATGVLQNPNECLKPEWQERLEEASDADKPMFIITPEEAKANESNRDNERQTWIFEAERVRDFAFAASRKFIWDAMGVDPEIVPDDDAQSGNNEPSDDLAAEETKKKRTLCMSYYPNEAEPLWSQYSTEAIAHTIEVYGKYALTYPYPIAISVNGPVYGMEYPMICFNGPRPEDDKTYSRATKYSLISVIIHEVGHNFFPMIVNSDERQWTWMDEGLNTFLQYLAEREWEEDYPSRRGYPENMTSYMAGQNQRPIMTGSEEILQFGNNAYGKPATALNVLRETILGRELFDRSEER